MRRHCLSSSSSSSSSSLSGSIGCNKKKEEESRLARVKRVLFGGGGGGGGGGGNLNRIFGAHLEHVDSYLDTGVPYIVHRLCSYIENYGFHSATIFRLSGGSPRLTERLRNAFERKGDADLEGSSCPTTAATLLRQYLIELPQPLVPSLLVAQLLRIHDKSAAWIDETRQLLQQNLPLSHYRLFGYLANYLGRYEARHGRGSGVCGVFAPVLLPHVPPATTLLRDILTEACAIFPENSLTTIIPRKRKELRQPGCCKLIRSISEEQILTINNSKSIRRVSSHENFINSDKCIIEDVDLTIQSYPSTLDCDVERVRSSERSSSITPRGRRIARRKNNISKINNISHTGTGNGNDDGGGGGGETSTGQNFLEMLSSGPSRSPSPVRVTLVNDNPVPTNWGNFQHHVEHVEARLSPRNSLLVPRRFYTTTNNDGDAHNHDDNGGGGGGGGHYEKTLTKHINGLKKKIKKYEDEFEQNFGYRPSHSDKMSNQDIKRLCNELNKLRKEHKLMKEDPISALKRTNFITSSSSSSSGGGGGGGGGCGGGSLEKSKLVEEMVKEVDKKLAEKRIKCNRSANLDDLTYEQLVDEKTAVQKALLHIEGTFGRPVSKDERSVVRPLYDRYRTLKRMLIRDSISELATILEHEAMDFTSASSHGGNNGDCRRASEPDMSHHRGILDCIDDVAPADDSLHSSLSEDIGDNLYAISREDLVVQQKRMREDKKRLRRALKELEVQFEARAGRKMQREDRGPDVTTVYESYKQTKAKLRLIDALLAK